MKTRNRQLNINCIGLSGRILALSFLLFAIGLGSARANTVLWSEGFEGYNLVSGQTYGSLDKNVAVGDNIAANGVGNPWFGPSPNNGWVTEAMENPALLQDTVPPHSGTKMMRGNQDGVGTWYSQWDNDRDSVNLAYRFHGGAPLQGKFSIDWWFYDVCGNLYPVTDLDSGPSNFGDHAGIEYSTLAPSNSDYVGNGYVGTPGPDGAPNGSTDSYAVTARLAIGAYQATSSGYDNTVYQVQVQGATDAGTFGVATDHFGTGWFNTTFQRINGWRHAAITVDGNKMAVFSIDDTAVLKHATGAPNGFNVFTTTELQPTDGNNNQSAYYDDITLALITGPRIVSTSVSGTTDLVVNATDGLVGWTYKVLMSSDVTQPLNQWTTVATSVATATGPFTITANNVVSVSNPKRFFAIQGSIQP